MRYINPPYFFFCASASSEFDPFRGATVRNGLTCWSVWDVSQNSPQIPSRGMYNHQGMPSGHVSAGGRRIHSMRYIYLRILDKPDLGPKLTTVLTLHNPSSIHLSTCGT